MRQIATRSQGLAVTKSWLGEGVKPQPVERWVTRPERLSPCPLRCRPQYDRFDGDAVIFKGWCEAPGAVRMGFGVCRGEVLGVNAKLQGVTYPQP